MKNISLFISLFFVLSCKTVKQKSGIPFGGDFPKQVVSNTAIYQSTTLDSQTVEGSPSSANIDLSACAEQSEIYILPNTRTGTATALMENRNVPTEPEKTNKNITIGTKLFAAGTTGLLIFALLAMLLSSPIATFMYPLIWLSVGTMLTGVGFGYAGWRQLRLNKKSEGGHTRGKIASVLFWIFASLLVLVAIGAAYVVLFDPTGGE